MSTLLILYIHNRVGVSLVFPHRKELRLNHFDELSLNNLWQEMEMEQKLDQLKDEIYRTVEENKGLKKVIYYFQLLN